jgi:hypothetical protein
MPRKRATSAGFLRGYLEKGWTKKQIEYRTGMPVRAQTDALTGRRSGAKYLDALRQGRQAGGGRAPAPGRPVTPVKGAGGGTVKLPDGRKVTEATASTDPAYVRQQLKQAGDQKISFTVTGKGVRRYSGPVQREAEYQLFSKGGWSAQSFLDRVDSPRSGDEWRSGDIFGAIRGMSKQAGHVDQVDKVTGVRFES